MLEHFLARAFMYLIIIVHCHGGIAEKTTTPCSCPTKPEIEGTKKIAVDGNVM